MKLWFARKPPILPFQGKAFAVVVVDKVFAVKRLQDNAFVSPCTKELWKGINAHRFCRIDRVEDANRLARELEAFAV